MDHMDLHRVSRKKLIACAVLTAGALLFFYFALVLRPVAGEAELVEFRVRSGDGFGEISERLTGDGLVRSKFAFRAVSLVSGAAPRLKPGEYLLSAASSTLEIVSQLVGGASREVEVRIPDGASLYQIDRVLSDAGVLPEGEFLGYVFSLPDNQEGKLFPDTYRFFLESSPEEAFRKLHDNFRDKALPVLERAPQELEENLILASLVEKEVPDYEERRVVAGILIKRLRAGIPLQVDATVCYVKQRLNGNYVPCYPLTESDLKISSPYNTYLNKGLPPGPIGSPELEAINAAMDPVDSPYWFYLSDPETHKTIFAGTLEEHAANRARYLR